LEKAILEASLMAWRHIFRKMPPKGRENLILTFLCFKTLVFRIHAKIPITKHEDSTTG
jgi:hypothetical protein